MAARRCHAAATRRAGHGGRPRSRRRRCCRRAPRAGGGLSYDPDGILRDAAPRQAGIIEARLAARRERQAEALRAAQAACDALEGEEELARELAEGAQRGAAGRILRTPQGEPLALKDAPALREALSAFLRREFMEVSDELLQRATVHCLDPPVLSVDGLVGEGQCGEVRDAAGATGELVRSRVGASEFSVAADDSGGDIRTSSSLLVNTEVRERHPLLAAAIDGLQAAGRTLLCGGGSWTAPGMLPPAGAFCYEATQVAKYSTGQHFLAHEDAFPLHAARAQRFQRRATLLVYLNTPEGGGGTTRFEHVGCEVAPQRGRALLFFPARGGDEAGTPDARTLHTATDADGEKWIAQLWVGWGMPESGPAPPPPPQQQQAAVETSVASAAALAHVEAPPKPAMRKKKKRGAGGFGNKK